MEALIHSRALTSFRPLLLTWCILLGAGACAAIGLQLIGPAPRVLPQAAAPARPEAARVAAIRPAQARPSDPHPVPLPPLSAASIPDPDPALLEPGELLPDRLLPRMLGPDRSARLLYAAAFDPAERHPRVALVIDGAGLDRTLTAQAIAALPSAIDLAFSAYAPMDVAAGLAARGRQQGRECLVSIPMEPSGFPEVEEGNRALSIGASAGQNRQNLEWAMSNVAGCVGATGGSDGLAGERFAESSQAFGDMLATLDRRGLLYLDSRPSAASRVSLPQGQVPFRTDVFVDRGSETDEPADAQAIDRKLAALAQMAAHTGSAIGLAGPPTPVLLDRVAVWAHGLAAQGIVLAPLSAMPPPPKQETPP